MQGVVRATVAAVLLLFLGCAPPSVERLKSRPPLDELEIETVISRADSFLVSGATSDADCGILVVASRWGSLVHLGSDGSVIARRRATYFRRTARLELADESSAVLWSSEPASVGLVDFGNLSVRRVPVAEDEWGHSQLGGVYWLDDDRILLSAFGEGGPLEAPAPWAGASLARVVATDGTLQYRVGRVERGEGRFLPWHNTRLVVGSVGDTMIALRRVDGRLTGHVREDGGPWRERWTAQLPRYIASPDPREEVFDPEWIQVGGTMPLILAISQVREAAVGRDGTVFTVRPYMATWREARNRFVPTQGVWTVTEQGLEVYTHRGELLGAYSLPVASVAWLRAGRFGRLFISDGTGSVYVVKDPTYSGRTCPALPETLAVNMTDLPPTELAVD